MGKKNKQLTSNNNKNKSKYMFYHHFNISQQEGSEAETNSRETLNLLHKDKPWHILTSSKRMVSVVGTFLEEQQLSSTT